MVWWTFKIIFLLLDGIMKYSDYIVIMHFCCCCCFTKGKQLEKKKILEFYVKMYLSVNISTRKFKVNLLSTDFKEARQRSQFIFTRFLQEITKLHKWNLSIYRSNISWKKKSIARDINQFLSALYTCHFILFRNLFTLCGNIIAITAVVARQSDEGCSLFPPNPERVHDLKKRWLNTALLLM